MQKYFNNVTNRRGDAVRGATVTVTTAAGATATIYSDNGVTTQTNPMTTDVNGYFSFYAADGTYTLTIAGAGIPTQTVTGVQLADMYNSSAVAITGGTISGVTISSLVSPRRRIASQHGGWLIPVVPRSNGTALSGTDRLQWTPNTDITGPEFVFANGFPDATGLLNPTGNVVPFYAGLEIAGNQLTPISFQQNSGAPISTGGKTGVNLGDGCMLHSLPTRGGVFSAGSSQFYRTYKVVTAGQKWPFIHASVNQSWQGINTTDAVYGAGVTDQSDQTATFAAQAWGAYAGTAYAFGAVAIIAEQVIPVPVVFITGDSIPAGTGDVAGRGYIGRALGTASVAYHNNSLAGASLTNLTKFGQVPQYLARYADHVVIHALTNDLAAASVTTLAQAQALLLSSAKTFGCKTNKLWFCTVLPRTTSSDSWATAGSQTVTAYEALRVQINNWLRDSSSAGAVSQLTASLSGTGVTVAGVIDACPGVEKNSDGSALVLDSNKQQTAATGGRWVTNGSANTYTSDGIHPNTAATALMAAYVPTVSFTIV